MNRNAIALSAFVFVLFFSADVAAAGGFRHPGHSGRSLGGFKQSHGFRAPSGGRGFHSRSDSRGAHPRHFERHKRFHHKKQFAPRRSFRHRPIIPGHGLHRGLIFGHRIIGVPSSSIIIWSRPAPITTYVTPPHRGAVYVESTVERPLITIMLRNRLQLGLSPEQVQDLENLREEYQREAIRYDADIRIAEMDLQQLLRSESVDLKQVKAKLQESERLKTELRFARLRTIERGKAVLSPEQHEKLDALLGESRYSRSEYEPSSPTAPRLAPPADRLLPIIKPTNPTSPFNPWNYWNG